jgi:hypothetical protein
VSGVVAFVPDLMDRSRLSAALADVRFVRAAGDLVDAGAAVVVVDLGRPGVVDVLPRLGGARVVGFGSHVDRATLDAAKAAGCDVVLARSAFFADPARWVGDAPASDEVE